MELEEYQCVRDWLANFPDEPNTRRMYLWFLRRFLESEDVAPDKLLERAKDNPFEVAKTLKSYFNRLVSEGYASNTAMMYLTAVRSFLTWNGASLPRFGRGIRGKTEHESGRLLLREEVASMVDLAPTVRDKALICFLAQSGQRASILTAMKVKHVIRDLEAGNIPIIVEVPPVLRNIKGINVNKVDEKYRFPLGADTAKYLRLMLQEREKHGEPIDGESWLFRSYRVYRYGKIMRAKVDEPGTPLALISIERVVSQVAEACGIQRKYTEKRSEIHPHVFRAYANICWQQAGLSHDLREMFLGHRDRYGGTYNRWTPQKIREEWLSKNVEQFISITKPPGMSEEEIKILSLQQSAKAVNPKVAEKVDEIISLYKRGALKAKDVEDEVLKLLRLQREIGAMTETNGGFKVVTVSFDELDTYIARGWEIIAQNGEKYKLRKAS